VGDLNLLKGNHESAEDLQNGIPIMYRVRFPLQYPLPKVSEILFNGASICKGETG
jgi:hypothetical protein